MTAERVLKRARAAGVAIKLDGAELLLTAATQPPADVLDALSRHKGEIVALLRAVPATVGQPRNGGWFAEDWQAYFDERAGIAEFDGGRQRVGAENLAFESCITEWLDRNFVPSLPGRCAACRLGDHAQDPLLPFGSRRTGHAWLHSRCWPAWDSRRKVEAAAALSAMGIRGPPT